MQEVFSCNHSDDLRQSYSDESGKDQLLITKSGRGRLGEQSIFTVYE